MRSATLCCLPLLLLISGCPAPNAGPNAAGPTGPNPVPVEPEPTAATEAELVTNLNGFADQMCACTDEACRQAAHARTDAYAQANKAELEKMSPEKSNAFKDRYAACLGGNVIEDFRELQVKMCACTNKECAESVNSEFEQWMEVNKNQKGTTAQQEEAKTIAESFMKCMATAMGEATGPAKPAMGQKCGAGDACADGLECVKYYGIAGPRGGEFTSCEKRCGKGKPACGDGLQCTTISDGPGQVCRAKR